MRGVFKRLRPVDFRSTNSLSLSDRERFWMKVDTAERPGGCWLWIGSTDKAGYGHLNLGDLPRLAHRAVLILDGRPIPKGAVVCHRCDVPRCVRPSHLFVGTMADNQSDMARKGRAARGTRHPAARLREEDARQALALRQNGLTISDIASRFGVSRTAISDLLSGKSWGHATGITRRRL